MNINRSGRAPDIIKIIAASLTALSVLLTGCDNSMGSSDTGSDPSYYSGNSDNSSDNSGESSDHSSVSSDNTHHSDNSSDPDSNGNSSNQENSGQGSSYSEPNSDPPDSDVSSTSSSSSMSTKPPPEVVIPKVKMPTSPGTKTAVGINGVIDYSNADQGYISAKYTGNKSRSRLIIQKSGETAYNPEVNVNGRVEYYPLMYGNGTYTVQLRELVEGTSYAMVTSVTFEVNMTNPRAPYTVPTQYTNYNQNSNCVRKGAEICAGKTGNIEKIAAIFQWVTENITYDYDLAATVKSSYIPDPDVTLSRKKGICFDYASLMASMLRSQGIPTRLVIGYASPDIYHAWNEIYTEQTGWITPELLLKNNGYNIADATFYSTSKDKKQISNYISNPSNYSAIYYY